ncbi:MAG TPA: glycosyltransferase family 4 protein [Candidatus Sulfotelmatobacter sp.]|jgi:glycosyltransferase involved in cell wall biosynthesis
MTSVLFYSDAAQFGGHEAMTVKAVRHLCQQNGLTVTFVFYAGNERLKEQLEVIQGFSSNLSLMPLGYKARTLQALRSLISWGRIRHIKNVMRQVHPDVVVVAQGRIEGGSMALLAAKRAGYRTISYLPVAHPVSISGKPFAVKIREAINGYFYRLPDKIITISESARRALGERGATPNVVIVPNAVEGPPIEQSDRQGFRALHGIKTDECLVATMGRIHFRQKGQDFALKAIARFRHELIDFKFLFVGEGPDEDKFKAMIADFDLCPQVKVVPWPQYPTEVYAGIDLLLIPSRFEGVPLVMLEAMSYRLPIVASNTDGMADLLPQEWLFPFGNCAALIETLRRVRKSANADLLETHRSLILSEFTMEKFCSNMRAAIFD